jgi:NitT/TauT family transport system substrate-binding protein
MPLSVRIGEPYHVVYYAPLHVALLAGFFEAHGLAADIVSSASFADLVDGWKTLSGGPREASVDQVGIAVGGIMRSLVAYDRGEPLVPVHFARVNDRDGFILLGRNLVFDWADLLEGETIVFAEAPTPLYVLRSYLLRKGLDVNRLRIIDSIPISDVGDAFRNGRGDFLLTQAHVAEELVQSGSAHLLKSMATEAGLLPYSSYYCAPGYLDSNPETVQAVALANAEALRWMQGHSAEDIWELIKPAFLDQDEAMLRAGTSRYKSLGVWDSDSTIPMNSYDALADALHRGGLISQIAPYELVIRDDPARRAEGDLGPRSPQPS